MTSSTSPTFKCLTRLQPVVIDTTCGCNPNLTPRIPRSVTDAIYNCRVCNETPFTFYRCSCDMGEPTRRVTVIPTPLPPIPEEENTQHFLDVFTFDDDGTVAPNSPEHGATLKPLLSINHEELPGDLISRYQAIDKIFRDAERR